MQKKYFLWKNIPPIMYDQTITFLPFVPIFYLLWNHRRDSQTPFWKPRMSWPPGNSRGLLLSNFGFGSAIIAIGCCHGDRMVSVVSAPENIATESEYIYIYMSQCYHVNQ